MATIADRLTPSPEVASALAEGRPVVALESTLISHGLPYPKNLEVARAAEAAVREGGAVPATIAIRDGRILIGLLEAELEKLARAPAGSIVKASRPNLALALRAGRAATTVSATMIAAAAAGIRVFATGGVGGVHFGALGTTNGAEPTFDVSADLQELARTAVAVVCAGPKSILDVALTMEYLETHGVPVLAVGQDDIPGFYSRSSGIRADATVADEGEAADLVDLHLGLGLGSGILVCVPVPEPDALPEEVAREAVATAQADARERAIRGAALTPWLLARVAELTDGRSIRANVALIQNNARFAGGLAAALRQRTAA